MNNEIVFNTINKNTKEKKDVPRGTSFYKVEMMKIQKHVFHVKQKNNSSFTVVFVLFFEYNINNITKVKVIV